MKILQLCKKFPYPLKDGESIAVTYLSRALQDLGCEITLLSMNTTKHYTDLSILPEEFNHYNEIHFTELDNSIRVIDAFRNLFSSKSYHVSRFVSAAFEEKLISLLKKNEYDVVQLETLYLTPYIPIIKQHSSAIVSMRAHNVEFEIWERITGNTTFLPKKWYLNHLTKKLKKYELEHLNDYDYLVAVTDRDLRRFKDLGYKNGAMASPIGLDMKNYQGIKISPKISEDICFIGALDWMPNVEGLEWFLDKVWPKVHALKPNLKFHVAGRNTPENISNMSIPNVVIHGEVPDAIQFINRFRTMVVPLFSGSGMRVKILEGMALSKAIVTTSLGKEGIVVEHKEHLYVADTVDAFVESIVDCVEKASETEAMGERAMQFVKEYYDHKSNAIRLMDKYASLIASPYHLEK